MLFTLAGISILVKELQYQNAYSLMLVTPLGITIVATYLFFTPVTSLPVLSYIKTSSMIFIL
jgi:hypothetical protein